MDDRPTIGVLSTSYGGHYFGSVLGGIARATAAARGRIIAIQTLDAGTFAVDFAEPPNFRYQVGWEHISGFIVILNAVDHVFLNAARSAGKPIVMISDALEGFACPVVLPDNKVGMREAVTHLIEHGHRRIGFAGYPVQRDFRERLEAYRDTLIEHGIEPEPELFFNTGNNQESGGERAAQTMIAAGMPATAVVTGNDLNAIGLIRTLTAAGYELPRDQAVVGFDDMSDAVYLAPSLSSIRQRFDDVGALATKLVLDNLAGAALPAETHHVPTTFVARESCGCSDPLALGAEAGQAAVPIRAADELTARLAAIVAPGYRGHDDMAGVVRQAVRAIVDALEAAAEERTGPTISQIRQALAGLYRLHALPESLAEIVRCVRQYGRSVTVRCLGSGDTAAAIRVNDWVQELIVALFHAQARNQFLESAHFLSTLTTQYRVSMNLLRSHERDPRVLSWLEDTPARAGCLGLWAAGPVGVDDRAGGGGPRDPVGPAGTGGADGLELDVVSVFERTGQTLVATSACPVRSFPPRELIATSELAADEMVYVAPVKVNSSEWGMLALVGPIEACVPTGREMMNQWAALLTIALDHEAVLESLREQEERLRHAALYDSLTGLANRALFLDRLRHALAHTTRRPCSFAVLLLDLDGFKVVNDSLGHFAGDGLLVQVAERIKIGLRDTDLAARFGGDEFAVLLDEMSDPDSAVSVAERIHSALREPFQLADHEVTVTSSIGIALSAVGYEQAEDVVRDADTAMYWAKSREKGSHAVFDVAMRAAAVGRLRIEAELRHALDVGELELHYQPIVDLRNGRTAAFEALVRWRHPRRGLVPPGEFLSIAEESGLIVPIDRWVMGEACRQVRAWQVANPGGPPVRISVNISNPQFWHGHLLENVRDCLSGHDLEPSRLALEITEGVIMHDVKLARRMLGQLNEMGVELHIDDFGTGYSSLEALHRLSIDALKIDRSFVASLGDDQKSRELVRTIVLMASHLGLELVAEGVETVDQADRLHAMGCTYGQGYWFSRPVPGAQAEALMFRNWSDLGGRLSGSAAR